jgi:hypothetical protein
MVYISTLMDYGALTGASRRRVVLYNWLLSTAYVPDDVT